MPLLALGALTAVAAVGYLLGRRARSVEVFEEVESRREIRRAVAVADELDRLSAAVEQGLLRHRADVGRFRARLAQSSGEQRDVGWKQLCKEAENLLKPTQRLATTLAQCYDEIRQQTNQLMTFTEVRTDPLTGLSNRRALDEELASQAALKTRYHVGFSLAIFDVDHFKRVNDEQGHLAGDRVLQCIARLIDGGVRETDLVARYGGEEFVVLMPQTDFDGACLLCERLRAKVQRNSGVTVSAGVATMLEWETAAELLARADAALYGAKAAGRNGVFRHTGNTVDLVPAEIAAEAT